MATFNILQLLLQKKLWPPQDKLLVAAEAENDGKTNELQNKVRRAFQTPAFAQNLASFGITQLPELAALPDIQNSSNLSYRVVGIDSSQIYPSRHHPVKAGLTKSAAVIFDYDHASSTAKFNKLEDSKIFTPLELQQALGPEIFASESAFDCLRQLEELKWALCLAKEFSQADDKNFKTIFMLDAALNLKFLDSFCEQLKTVMLGKYLAVLQEFKQVKKCLVCSYTSWPSNNKVCKATKNIFCAAPYFARSKCFGGCGQDLCAMLGPLNDAELWDFAAVPTVIFQEYLGNDYSLFFTYLATQSEVARLDFPAVPNDQVNHTGFVAQKDLTYLFAVILDQVKKGFGYPLALAEAHVAANLLAYEKDFFYQALGYRKDISPKLFSKKNIFG